MNLFKYDLHFINSNKKLKNNYLNFRYKNLCEFATSDK